MYNKTQLNPDTAFERHIFHRDQFAHYLRWSHILKVLYSLNNKQANILDFGCGSGNLLEVIYRNRVNIGEYLGIDIRPQTINNNLKRCSKYKPKHSFMCRDLVKDKINVKPNKGKWNIISCFEVLEHVGKENVPKLINNIVNNMSKETTLYISTPKYDAKVGAAANHIINGKVGELTYKELKTILKKAGLKIIQKYGTFASISDYKDVLTTEQSNVFNGLRNYFDTNMLSVIFAPLVPKQSRNILWICKLK